MLWFKRLEIWVLLIAIVGGVPGIVAIFSFIQDRPILRGEIHHFITGQPILPIIINGKSHPTTLLVYFYVTNHKKNPVRLLNRYKLDIYVDGKRIEAPSYYIDPKTACFSFTNENQVKNFTFEKDYLLSKTDLPPIKYGEIIKG